MHDLAIISKIQSIVPIEGKDRIVLAKVENYDTIVQKDEFSVGDEVVYVFYDAILPPKPEFEFLRKRCWSEKWQGFRIRPMKLGNKVSEGLVLPMSVLPKNKTYKIGQVVTEDLEIRRYDTENFDTAPKKEFKGILKLMMKFAWFRKLYGKWIDYKKAHSDRNYPTWITKSDEDNIEKLWDTLKDVKRPFILTEKVEGMSTTFAIEKGKFKVYSHNWRVKEGSWVDYATHNHIEAKLRKLCKELKFKSIAIQGELVGPSIQKNIYHLDTLDFYMFGGYFSDRKRFTFTNVANFAKYLGLKTVPIIRTDFISNFATVDELIKDADGVSTIYNTKREGLVWRTEDGDVHFKAKSRDYKIWWNEKDK